MQPGKFPTTEVTVIEGFKLQKSEIKVHKKYRKSSS